MYIVATNRGYLKELAHSATKNALVGLLLPHIPINQLNLTESKNDKTWFDSSGHQAALGPCSFAEIVI